MININLRENDRSRDIDCIYVSVDVWVQLVQNDDIEGLSELNSVSV